MRPFNMVLHILIQLLVSRNISIKTNLNFIHNYNIFLHFQDIVRTKKFCNNLLRLKLLHVLESPTNLSSKATKTKEREKIFQIVFLLACQCVAVVQRFFVTRVVHSVTNSHNLKKILCMSKTCFYYLVLAFSACVAFSVTQIQKFV